MLTSKRKHTSLTLKKKMEILKKLDYGANPKALASLYGVGRATIYDIRRNRERISQFVGSMVTGPGKRYTLRFGGFPMVESALYTWFLQERRSNAPMSGDILRAKAKDLYKSLTNKDDFRASDGWLDNFKKRFGIRLSAVPEHKPSVTQATQSTSSLTQIFGNDRLNETNVTEQVGQSTSSQEEIEIDDPLRELHTCIDIKEEFNDGFNGEGNAQLEESDTIVQYEATQVKIEEPFDEAAMAVSAIPSFDEDCSQPAEPFIKIIRSSTNSPVSTYTDINNVNDTSSRKRNISDTNATFCGTDEMDGNHRRKVSKINRPESTSESTNEFTIFGRYVASQLKLLPLCSSLQLQCDIQNLIVKARLRHQDGNK